MLVTQNQKHQSVESKRSSPGRVRTGKNRPERPKPQKSVDKIMASVFWNTDEILFVEYLQKGKSIKMHFIEYRNQEKTAPYAKKRSYISPGQYFMSQIDDNNV